MPVIFRHALLLLSAALCQRALAAECLVVGDSLTKEYEVEFPALYPANPASWSARNWAEILHERRNNWFDLGRFSAYADPRLTGHEHNWAFPGATTQEIRGQLGNILNFWWIMELEGQLEDEAERVVIFAGGNDVDCYYGSIYNGASAAPHINATRDNLQWIVNYVRGVKSSMHIVLVSVPHLGCSPKVQTEHPSDPVKTARVTAALDSLNAQLASFAASKGIGFAPGVYELTRAMITDPFRIGGIEFYKQADADSRARYVFSGDGFHPATSAHGKIAQIILETFRSKYLTTQIPPLTDREIVSQILGLDPDIPFHEWMATQEVPAWAGGLLDDPDGDGLANAVEFALEEGAAGLFSPGLFAPGVERSGGQARLRWTWKERGIASEWAAARLQHSADLHAWSEVDSALITLNMDGSQTVRLPLAGRGFLRLLVAQ
ncbi:MAG TPA: hypothetical protein DIT64_15965 [Verrucomicrobiales bacterium]|nr:hypothetical protein [Verrucomicrobiales bacterium]